MSINDSALNSDFKQNQFASNTSDKKSGHALSQSVDKTIKRIEGLQSKITKAATEVSISDMQKALGRIEAKVLKAKEFLHDVDETFIQLVAQKEILKSELEELANPSINSNKDFISIKEKELQTLDKQIQEIESFRSAPQYINATLMVSNALQQVRESLAFSKKGIARALVLFEEDNYSISQIEKEELFNCTSRLVNLKMEEVEIIEVMQCLADIPQGERGDLAECAAKIMNEEMSGSTVSAVIRALSKIPQRERLEFSLCTAKLVLPVPPEIIFEGIDYYLSTEISSVMEILSRFPQRERTELSEQIVTLVPKNSSARLNIMKALAARPQEERAELVECTAKLVTEQLKGHDVVSIIRSLIQVPKGERADLLDYTAKLGMEKMSLRDQLDLMKTLAKVLKEERSEIVESTAKLVTKEMSESDIKNVIQLLAAVPQRARKKLIHFSAKLVTEWMSFVNIHNIYNYHCHDPVIPQNESSNQIIFDKLGNLLMKFRNVCDKKETVEIKRDSFDRGLKWLNGLIDGFLKEKISSEQMNFFLDKELLKVAMNYNDDEVRSRLSFHMVDSVKHPDIFKELWDDKLPLHTKIPLILIAGLKAQGLDAKAIQELLVTAGNNTFKDGKNLKVFVDGIMSLLESQDLSTEDKEFIISKLKLPPKSEKPALKATFSFLHAITAFKIMNRLSRLSRDQLEDSSIQEIIQKTIIELIPMELNPDFEELFAKYFGTDRVPNFLLIYAAKLESLRMEKDTMLKFLGVTVGSILKGDFPSSRYETKGEHLSTIFSGRAELLEEWRKGKKVSLGDYIMQTDEKAKPVNFQTLLKDKVITHQHIKKELVPQLYAFLDEGTPQEINGTDPLSMIQKNCIDLTNEKLSLASQKNLLKEINKALSEIKGDGEEFKYDISGFLSGLIKQDEVVTSYNRFTIEDTDNYLDLFFAGQEVANSCQRLDGDPNLNKCLLGYVADGKNRLLAIKDIEGKIVARQIFRILWDGEKPVLLTEPIYPDLVKPAYSKALELFAKQRAKELGLTLLAVTEDSSLPAYGKAVHSLGSPAPYEYSDTADRTGFGAGVTMGTYTVSNAKIIQD